MTYQIIPAAAAHLDQVEKIEKACFADPWSRTVFEDVLSLDNAVFLSAQAENGTISGYIICTTVLDEGNVDNIAVCPDCRRQGVASSLLAAFHQYGREHGLTSLFLEVRPSNRNAIRLYERFGYSEVGRRKNYYLSPKEDAIIMRLELTQ